MAAVRVDIGEELIEQIARRAAELLADRAGAAESEEGGYLDVVGAAEFLSCPKSRIYSLASLGRIPHYHDGSRLLFDRAELREYVRNGGARRP
ncbi:MAG TPA: helix-turn-helix domain-containing protein [Solirubrobacterales bacterium]|nr:helix-turn-helix domain-containing protein [Solirubrobacterales bacterium]